MAATKKRTSKKVISNVTLEQAQAASESFAVNQNKLDSIEAKMNKEINAIKTKYAEDVTALQEMLSEPMDILEAFAKEQQTSWGKKKSLELLHTTIGFRIGNPKVEKKKGFDWEGILSLMKKNNVFSGFIRTTEEVNKEAILAEKNEAVLNQLKEEAFVWVGQDEKFYVDVKKEELATA